MNQLTHGIASKTCPQCGYEELIDALFFLPAAAMLIPMTLTSLRKFLSRHKAEFPATCGHYGPQRHRYRLLTGDEVRRIRQMLIAGPKLGTLNDRLRRGSVAKAKESDRKANASERCAT